MIVLRTYSYLHKNSLNNSMKYEIILAMLFLARIVDELVEPSVEAILCKSLVV